MINRYFEYLLEGIIITLAIPWVIVSLATAIVIYPFCKLILWARNELL